MAALPEMVSARGLRRRSAKMARPLRRGHRGWTTAVGGTAGVVAAAPEWRGTTVQVCGLWPFIAGTGTPMVGVPLGLHLVSGAVVCSDPISWFAEAGLIPNPSVMVIGRPGLGKSTLVRRMATGLCAFGVAPMVFGDLKPDYVQLIEALGGGVVALGRGRGQLNVLDPGSAVAVAKRLTGAAASQLVADAHGRRLSVLSSLIAVNRTTAPTDHEEAVLTAALRILDERHKPGEATLRELVDVLSEGPAALQEATLARGDDARYRAAVDPLQRSIGALIEGSMGAVFAGRTTTRIDLTKPLCIDISGISESDEKLQAAVLLACWAEGFGSIEALQALADARLERQRNFFVILDELWRVLRAGAGMVDRIDAVLRLDRQKGVGTAIVTHSIKDLAGDQARGFAERIGYYAYAGVPAAEVPVIRELTQLSQREAELVTSWSTPETWDPRTGRRADPPGLGKVLLKVGGRPGIPVQVRLTSVEHDASNTNSRWSATQGTWS